MAKEYLNRQLDEAVEELFVMGAEVINAPIASRLVADLHQTYLSAALGTLLCTCTVYTYSCRECCEIGR